MKRHILQQIKNKKSNWPTSSLTLNLYLKNGLFYVLGHKSNKKAKLNTKTQYRDFEQPKSNVRQRIISYMGLPLVRFLEASIFLFNLLVSPTIVTKSPFDVSFYEIYKEEFFFWKKVVLKKTDRVVALHMHYIPTHKAMLEQTYLEPHIIIYIYSEISTSKQ